MANKEKSIACTFCQKRYRITIAMQSKNGKRMRCSRCEKVFRVQIPVVYLERQEEAAELKQVENSLGLLRKITINSLGAVTTTFLVAYLYQYASIMGGLIIGIVGAIAIHAIMRYAYNYCSNADKKKAVCKLCNRSLYHIIHMWWIDLLMFILKAGIAIAVLQFLAFLMFLNSSYYADVITGVVCIAIIWCIWHQFTFKRRHGKDICEPCMDNAFTQLPKKAFQSSGALVALFYMVGFGVGTTWVNKDHAEAKHYYEAWAKKIELSIETHGKCPENYEIMMEGVEKPRLVNNHMQITCEDKAYSMSYVDITGCIFPPTYVYTSETKEWTVYD